MALLLEKVASSVRQSGDSIIRKDIGIRTSMVERTLNFGIPFTDTSNKQNLHIKQNCCILRDNKIRML